MSFEQYIGSNWVEVRLHLLYRDALSIEEENFVGATLIHTPVDEILEKEKLALLNVIVHECLTCKELIVFQLIMAGEADNFSHAARLAGLNKMAVSRMIQKLKRELARVLDC